MWENASPEDGIEVARSYAIVLAMHALRVSQSVRSRYGLPSFDTPAVWPDFLSDEYDALPAHWHEDASR